jgi:hypothetical protein
VARSFASDGPLTARPISSRDPRVGIESTASKVTKSNRCPSTNTFVTM